MKVRGKAKPSIGAGVHLVKIVDVKYARKADGEILHTREGEPAIEVFFETKDKRKITTVMWYTANGQWVIDAMCKEIDIDNKTKEPDIEEIIGKGLYIVVAEEHHMNAESPKLDFTEQPIIELKVLPQFFRYIENGSVPRIKGDPNFDGVASGKFRIEKQVA